jgi:hypothetical protein
MLLRLLPQTQGEERRELLNRISRLVFSHAFAEEAVLWPALRRHLPAAPGPARRGGRAASGRLARVAGVVEQLAPLRRGERTDTHVEVEEES